MRGYKQRRELLEPKQAPEVVPFIDTLRTREHGGIIRSRPSRAALPVEQLHCRVPNVFPD
jgi:hypothetical protein